MGKFDIILSIPLIWGAIIGFKKGLILELATLLALVLGIFGSIKFSSFTSFKISEFLAVKSEWVTAMGFCTTFILIVIGIFLLANLLSKSLKLIALGFFNRLMGAIFGLAKYALLLSFVLYFFDKIDDKFNLVDKSFKQNSLLYEPISYVKEPFSEYIKDLDSLDINSKVNKTKELILE